MKCFCAVQFSYKRVKNEAWPICSSLSRAAKEQQQHSSQVHHPTSRALWPSPFQGKQACKTGVNPSPISMFPSAFPSSVFSEEPCSSCLWQLPCSVCSGRAALTHFSQRRLTRSCWSWVYRSGLDQLNLMS